MLLSPPNQGVSISEAVGKYFGNLPKTSMLTREDNTVHPDTMLGQHTQAPKPLPETVEDEEDEPPELGYSSDEDGHRPPLSPKQHPPTEGTFEPQFVGHVESEEDMENQYVFYRPSSGKRVLIIDRKKNECFFLKWKTFKKEQRKGRELDPRYFDQLEKQKFTDSDAKEWKSFLDTGAVTAISPEQA